MKTGFFRRNALFILLASFLLSAAFIACSKDDNTNNSTMYNTSGNASGSQQSPPVTTSGSGVLTGTYNSQTNNWQYSVNWTTLTSPATLVEVHGPAAPGVNGNLLFSLNITTPGVNGSATGNVTLTPQQEEYLLSGETYYTILTAANISGEIRGQVVVSVQ